MRVPLFPLRCALLVALAGSAVSLADDSFHTRPFCGFDSGCDAVTGTVYGRPFGVPLAAVGLVGFGALFALTLFPAARAFALVGPGAVLAGLGGLGLIGIQAFVLGQLCPVCLCVDAAAVAAAGLAVRGRVWRGGGAEVSWPVRGAWLAGAAVAAGAPFGLGLLVVDPNPPPPDQVREHWVEGAVTMVELSDFDCPACQVAEPRIAAFRQKHPEVRFVRLVAPMPSHANALPAGRAYLAARAQGKGDEMATRLFAADTRTPERCRQIAAELGLDMTAYGRVVNDPATDAELNATLAWARDAAAKLPQVWIQEQGFPGAPSAGDLEAALARVGTK
jgi:uncharacterized membrane protein/predicted DsbA family dithiol-disulfide isomerase